MADAFLEWGGDLVLTPSGDLALSDGPDLTRQRIERRLFTAVRGYVWHQEYGAGLPERIGQPARAANIAALVRANIALEASVARLPVPSISVQDSSSITGLFLISIIYADAVTGTSVAISLEVPGTA